MDSVKRSEITPSKSRLARTFAKVLHIRAVKEPTPDDRKQKKKYDDKIKKDVVKNPSDADDGDGEMQDRTIKEAFVSKLFASLSSVKAGYAQLQFAQCPYDADGIQAADQAVVSELKNLSELKQSFLKKQLNDTSPETTLIRSEIQEQRCLLKTYEITCNKLNSQLKLKDSEITFLQEKLAEAAKDIKSLEKRMNSSGKISEPENIQLSDLKPSHFVAYLRPAKKSIRSFVRLLVGKMESADWDVDVAVSSIEPGISFLQPNHKCFVFESFVCKQMFDGFNYPNFSSRAKSVPDQESRRRMFFEKFMELKSIRTADYLVWKPKSTFAKFCRAKYLKLVHPKMEASFFGNLDQRNSVSSGEFPETPFFMAFSEMAKRVWVVHCLGQSFDPEVSIFQINRRACFSEVYMESLSDEAFWSSSENADPRVAFTVVPGFRIGKTVVQAQVYLS